MNDTEYRGRMVRALEDIAKQMSEAAEALNKGNTTAGDISKTLKDILRIWEDDASDGDADALLAELEAGLPFMDSRKEGPAKLLQLVAPGEDDRRK